MNIITNIKNMVKEVITDKLKVVELDLSNKNLVNIPLYLKEYPNLQKINLSFNKLSEPKDIQTLRTLCPKLEYIDLSNNSYKKVDYTGSLISINSFLKVIILNRNFIENLDWINNIDFYKLQVLNLSKNQLQNAFPYLDLPEIKDLDFSENKIDDITNIKHLVTLENFNGAYNLISKIPESFTMFKLDSFNLSHNVLNEFKNINFKSKHINVANNKIKSLAKDMKGFIYDLDISNNEIKVFENIIDNCLAFTTNGKYDRKIIRIVGNPLIYSKYNKKYLQKFNIVLDEEFKTIDRNLGMNIDLDFLNKNYIKDKKMNIKSLFKKNSNDITKINNIIINNKKKQKEKEKIYFKNKIDDKNNEISEEIVFF
jgi:hypothetical protein